MMPFVGVCGKCGARRIDQQLGSEETPEEYVAKLVAIFREVRRVLRIDGTVWLNLGDSYATGAMTGKRGPNSSSGYHRAQHGQAGRVRTEEQSGVTTGNLVGIPWRVAFALQADGWVLRQDIIWCLSGGAWLYVRSQKGDMPMMVRDMARLDPSTVQLWNGEKWTQLLGMSVSDRRGDEKEIVLRSGERISCTYTHKFPTTRGLLPAYQLKIGDRLMSCDLPEPDEPRDSEHIGLEAAWFAGLYLAEGASVETGKIQLAGHAKEVGRWERVQRIVASYGGSCTITVDGNNQSIRVYGKIICAIVQELISGHDCYDKAFSPVVWRYSNAFLESLMDGYMHGDGHEDPNNNRYRLGFTRNYNLERGLRTACARLGWILTLNTSFAKCGGKSYPTFRGEIRKARNVPGHHNQKDRDEVVDIRSARCREVWEIGVADEPHLYALASGILTHNSKPNPMPESVEKRCTKAHEYIFLLTQGMDYWYDGEAIKEKSVVEPHKPGNRLIAGEKTDRGHLEDRTWGNGTSNKRSVWTVATKGYPGAHFATYPPDLIRPCIRAGTSEYGACVKCGTPWDRVVEKVRRTRTVRESKHERDTTRGNRNGIDSTLDSGEWEDRVEHTRTVGWRQGCSCDTEEVRPCIVLDPFMGSGTTAQVCIEEERSAWGIELSEEYLLVNAIPRVEGVLLDRPGLRHLVRTADTSGG